MTGAFSSTPRNYGSGLEPSDTLDDFPGLSTVYLRLPWACLEPEAEMKKQDRPGYMWLGRNIGGWRSGTFHLGLFKLWELTRDPGYMEQMMKSYTDKTGISSSIPPIACITATPISSGKSTTGVRSSGDAATAGSSAAWCGCWTNSAPHTRELTLLGEANTGYEFYSSTDLSFNPGTRLTIMSQGDPPNDPGTVTDGDLLTTDGNGDGKVRITLTGNPADFVRAQSAP